MHQDPDKTSPPARGSHPVRLSVAQAAAVGLAVALAVYLMSPHTLLDATPRVSQGAWMTAGTDAPPPATEDDAWLDQVDHQLAKLTHRVADLESRLDQASSPGNVEFQDELAQIRTQLRESRHCVNTMLQQANWIERAVETLSEGVCLIQGEYMFFHPETGLPLRYLDEQDEQRATHPAAVAPTDGSAAEAPVPTLALSTSGRGAPLVVRYTGTGFLVDSEGHVVTNRHVAEPWTVSEQYRCVLDAGYQARQCQFRAFFPGQPRPFSLRLAACSPEDDVAILRADLGDTCIPALPCATQPTPLRVGQPVVVLGYPTGFDMLLARMARPDLEAIVAGGDGSFNALVESMARLGLIEPVATQGMCGRVGAGRVIYDAPTAIGGSGAPVLGPDGAVAAINTALLKGFAGTNFGVPIERALTLLDQLRTSAPVAPAPDAVALNPR